MLYKEMAKKIAQKILSNVMDFDMHNLIPPRNPMDNLEDAAEGAFEFLPRKTLRERGYGRKPLFCPQRPSPEFLERLRGPVQPGIVESADETNIWDFSMPEEWSKHQEQPYPREILDDFYEMSHPGEGAGKDDLDDYWDRGWDSEDSPEMSEDKWLRQGPKCDRRIPRRTLQVPFKSARRIVASFKADQLVDNSPGPSPSTIVAHYLMRRFPIQAWMNPAQGTRVAKLLSDLEKTKIRTHKVIHEINPDTGRMRRVRLPQDYRDLKIDGVTVRLKRAEPQIGRWTFTTGHGYTTVFQFIPHASITDLSKLHVRVNCSCNSFLYWGAQFNACLGEYLYGTIRIPFASPDVRDPDKKFLICKHILVAIPTVLKYHFGEVPPEVKKRLKEPPDIKVKFLKKPEKVRVPDRLKNFSTDPEVQEIMREWPTMLPRKKKERIMEMTSPGMVAFFAYRFPDEQTTAYVAEKLKDMALHHKIPSMKKWAKDLLKSIIQPTAGPEVKEPTQPAGPKTKKSPSFFKKLKEQSGRIWEKIKKTLTRRIFSDDMNEWMEIDHADHI